MTQYAICFDFPENPGEPWFAAMLSDGIGFAMNLENAMKFEHELAAEALLRYSYGPNIRECGTVVEVGQ